MSALFRKDAYLAECTAKVAALTDRGGVVLDQTVFYPTGGGQPGDSGRLIWDGGEVAIAIAVKGDAPDEVIHVAPEGAALPPVGTEVRAILDWDRRHRHMWVHTALHLLSVVIPLPVTGGQISSEKGRLDFDMPEAPGDKQALQHAIDALIAADHAVTDEWITDDELAAIILDRQTASVPPQTTGRKTSKRQKNTAWNTCLYCIPVSLG